MPHNYPNNYITQRHIIIQQISLPNLIPTIICLLWMIRFNLHKFRAQTSETNTQEHFLFLDRKRT